MRTKFPRNIFIAYLICLILIAVLPLNSASSKTLANVFVVHIRLDYFLHALLFIPWAFLYIVAFRPSNPGCKFVLVVAGLFAAFATEGVQFFLTYRAYNINDLLANLLGVLLGALVVFTNIPFAALTWLHRK